MSKKKYIMKDEAAEVTHRRILILKSGPDYRKYELRYSMYASPYEERPVEEVEFDTSVEGPITGLEQFIETALKQREYIKTLESTIAEYQDAQKKIMEHTRG